MKVYQTIKHHVQGFTLIELMIVLAIIGILAAIAIPIYVNQMTRARVSEGFELTGAAKVAVVVYYNANNSFPSSLAQAGASSGISGNYVSSVSIINNGVILVLYNASSGVGSDNRIELVPTASGGTITWACNGSGTTVEDKYLPARCR